MSKYQKLWDYIAAAKKTELLLSFKQIEEVLGFSIDHSFLNYKKELLNYGYKVEKISLKNHTVKCVGLLKE